MTGPPSTFVVFPDCDGTIFEPAISGSGSSMTINGNPKSYYTNLEYTNNSGKGLIQNSSFGSYYSKASKSWTNADGYLTIIKAAASSDTNSTPYYLLADNTVNKNAIVSQIAKDDEYFRRIKLEYCFLRKHYHGFLNAFFDAIKESNDTKAQVCLEILIELNAKINAFVSLVDFIASGRASVIDARTPNFKLKNQELNDYIISGPSASEAEFLDKQKSILDTRKEMVRYTKEKNNSITNNISLWAALNVVAIAMIFTLYRKM
jgi:hypothetical protein